MKIRIEEYGTFFKQILKFLLKDIEILSKRYKKHFVEHGDCIEEFLFS